MSPRSTPALITPSILKWARETTGYPINYVSEKIKVSPNELLDWENGTILPSYTKLEKLANLYKRSIAVFYLPSPPSEPSLPHDFRSLPIRKKYPLSPETKIEIRKIRKFQNIATDIIKDLEIKLPIIKKVDVSYNPEELALSYRKDLNINFKEQLEWNNPFEAFKNWRNIIEGLNILTMQVPIPLKEARGFTLLGTGIPTIAISSKDFVNGKIFSIFHEFGHILLGDEGIYTENEADKSKEIFCNHFAGAFLLPKDNLFELINSGMGLDDNDIIKFSRKIKVSKYVILRRLLTFNLINQTTYNEKIESWEEKDLPAPSYGRSEYSQKIISKRGNLYVSLLIRAKNRGLINERDVVNYLGEKSKHIPALEILTIG